MMSRCCTRTRTRRRRRTRRLLFAASVSTLCCCAVLLERVVVSRTTTAFPLVSSSSMRVRPTTISSKKCRRTNNDDNKIAYTTKTTAQQSRPWSCLNYFRHGAAHHHRPSEQQQVEVSDIKRVVSFSQPDDDDMAPSSSHKVGASVRLQVMMLPLLLTALLLLFFHSPLFASTACWAMDQPSVDQAILGVPIPVPDARYFLAGGVCAAASHGVTTPVDVIKTRIQAEPLAYQGVPLVEAASRIVQQDGVGVLLGGLGPTIAGYGLEGAAKFGLYESLKPVFANWASTAAAGYLGASVTAGAVASLLLCPMEQTRIRLVTDPAFVPGKRFLPALARLIRDEGWTTVLLGGFPAMLSKQVPYTFCKQVSFDVFAVSLYRAASDYANLAPSDVKAEVSVAAAFLASILACVASHPGDVILTDTYKKGSADTATVKIPKFADVVATVYREEGVGGFVTGISARFLHVGAIITSQLVLYDFVKQLLGLPATGT